MSRPQERPWVLWDLHLGACQVSRRLVFEADLNLIVTKAGKAGQWATSSNHPSRQSLYWTRPSAGRVLVASSAVHPVMEGDRMASSSGCHSSKGWCPLLPEAETEPKSVMRVVVGVASPLAVGLPSLANAWDQGIHFPCPRGSCAERGHRSYEEGNERRNPSTYPIHVSARTMRPDATAKEEVSVAASK